MTLLRDALFAVLCIGLLGSGLLRWSTETDASAAVRADFPAPSELNPPPMLRP